MKGIARRFSKNLQRVAPKAKDQFKKYLIQLNHTLKEDLTFKGWIYREIKSGSVIQEIELSKQNNDDRLCIKALPTKLDLDEELIETERSETRSLRIMDFLQQQSTNPNKPNIRQLLESAKNKVEEEESETITDGDRMEVAEIVRTASRFSLGVYPSDALSALVFLCKSENGKFSIERIYTATELLPGPKYDGKLFLADAINTKLYNGPRFEFIDSYLQILMHEYLERHGIDEQFILALELLSAGWEIRRTAESMSFLENFKSTNLIKA